MITRPAGQHTNLANQCRTLGFDIKLVPCIAIEPVPVSHEEIEQQNRTHEITLFTSTNAVRHAHMIAPLPWPGTQVHAIGAATASCLQSLGQKLSLTPQAPFSSETYLAQMRRRDERRLLIIKGIGGRDLIADKLRSTGWTVSCIDIYKRVPVRFEAEFINQLFSTDRPDVISIGSDEILTNLWQLSTEYHHTLRDIPLVVNSARCAALAMQLGFRKLPLVASPAGDAGQIICLQEWLKSCWR